jgi:hypothetical protein
MRARPTLAILALSLLAAGCGSASSKRPSVARYIREVNAIEKLLTAPLQSVTSTGKQFASSNGKSVGSLSSLSGLALEQSLLGALGRIRALRRRLAAIVPPPPAAHLRKLVVALVDGEAGMTNELAQLVAFLPRFSSTLTSLAPATSKLQSALAVTAPVGVGVAGVNAELAIKARALTRYEAALGNVVQKLVRLRPPPVSRPQFETQVGTLRRMSSSAGRLAQALAAGNSNVAPLLRAFDTAAQGNQSIASQRAQIAAIRAYDARAKRLDKLAVAVEVERARLANTLR